MTDVLALRGIAQELVAAGVTEVVVCPGSRSTPLALAVRAHPGLTVRVMLDERAAGYFALGLARASRRAVAIVVTSGTAVANLLPAVVEASMARVPLVVLTADRPPELRERGAPQTIDQVGIFGVHVRWSVDLPLLDGEADTRRHVRSVVGRAVAVASGSPAGPVHLNIPFREPLIPSAGLGPLIRPTTRSGLATVTRRSSPPGRASRPRPSLTWPPACPPRHAGSSWPARRMTRRCRRRSPDSRRPPGFPSSPIRFRASVPGPTIGAMSWRMRTISSGRVRGGTRTCPTSSSASGRRRRRSRC